MEKTPQGQNGSQTAKTCNTPDCAEAYILPNVLSTTWITAYKKVTFTQKVPYVVLETEWDSHGCAKTVSVTKHRLEEREIVVPYQKEVIVEEVGMEKIKICLAD